MSDHGSGGYWRDCREAGREARRRRRIGKRPQPAREVRYRHVTPEQFKEGYEERRSGWLERRQFEKVTELDNGTVVVREPGWESWRVTKSAVTDD